LKEAEMPEITAALVKDLREKTGAGMMDCKRALSETAGDVEGAVDWLRKKGLSAAAKKAGRVAAEGLVGVETQGRVGAVVEVNSETDFVARNDKFQALVTAVTKAAVAHGEDVSALKAVELPDGGTVESQLTQLVATIGENMSLRRARRLEVPNGTVIGYVHNALKPGLGKIGVLIALDSTADAAVLAGLGKQLAMHVAAASPLFLDVASVDPAMLSRERDVLKEKARASGKAEDILDNIVQGGIRKYYGEVVLLEQVYVIDGKTKVSKVIEEAAKAAGQPIKLAGFARFALGEGIDKATQDFAAEVAAVAKG
jgi:elongation factor Ts